mgnify:FL=1|jgi:hypothetical protein
MTQVSATVVLDTIAEALVSQEKYDTKEEALRALAKSAIHAKVSRYRRRILRLQRKYGQDFDAFSRSLRECATPEQEDDWLDWKSARAMVEEWQAVDASLSDEPTHR